MTTEFASTERSPVDEIIRQSELISRSCIQQIIVDNVPDIILVLNSNGQTVFANKCVTKLYGVSDVTLTYGQRPGELLNCVHACECESGCGTTKFCTECGAANAILTSLRGKENIQECRITQQKTGQAFDLRVQTVPLDIQGESFVVFIASDIEDEKRRTTLERIFLHDITNTVTSMLAFAEILEDLDTDRVSEIGRKIYKSGLQLVDQIDAQRELVAAEANELTVHPQPVNSLMLIREVLNLYDASEIAKERKLIIGSRAQEIIFKSDQVILTRVLSNMVKNAIEATEVGDTIVIDAYMDGNQIRFSVHNPGFILPRVQLQIFQRFFSTKGAGRGLGTYSIRLLTERYLKGKVTFSSSKNAGTMFSVQYPLMLEDTSTT